MNFTREPIVETVITPRGGCKLVIRNSKAGGGEEYLVDAVEVVSFGRSLFFRSLENPKSFLLPVGDYEVLESKEARMVLKNASMERSIKIGGGKESHRAKEPPVATEAEPPAEGKEVRSTERAGGERKRDKRRRGRRSRSSDSRSASTEAVKEEEVAEENAVVEAPVVNDEPKREEKPAKSPSFISKLFPPPPTLIKETLSRYKPAEPAKEEPENPSLERGDEPPLFHPEDADEEE